MLSRSIPILSTAHVALHELPRQRSSPCRLRQGVGLVAGSRRRGATFPRLLSPIPSNVARRPEHDRSRSLDAPWASPGCRPPATMGKVALLLFADRRLPDAQMRSSRGTHGRRRTSARPPWPSRADGRADPDLRNGPLSGRGTTIPERDSWRSVGLASGAAGRDRMNRSWVMRKHWRVQRPT